jgi:hypothetical protein
MSPRPVSHEFAPPITRELVPQKVIFPDDDFTPESGAMEMKHLTGEEIEAIHSIGVPVQKFSTEALHRIAREVKDAA